MDNTPPPLSDLMTAKEAAAYLRITPGTVYDKVKAGDLPHHHPGGGRAIRFRKAELDAYLAGASLVFTGIVLESDAAIYTITVGIDGRAGIPQVGERLEIRYLEAGGG